MYVGGFAIVALVVMLSIPCPEEKPVEQAPAVPFVWNQDEVWDDLEKLFLATREEGCDGVAPSVTSDLQRLRTKIIGLAAVNLSPSDSIWTGIEHELFPVAAKTAACTENAANLLATVNTLREAVKRQSIEWDMSSVEARQTLYRLLYGSRTALEEVLVQRSDSSLGLFINDVDAAETPSAVVQGVRIHSGDLLVSRGGFPTSALIARGSDYPGNFSHVALAHVDSTGNVSVVEAHIEVGVTVSDAETYLADKKLRLMVLRLRSDHPAVLADPLVAHTAATYALTRATSERIPYDFEMNYDDARKLFCSEVGSDAYRQVGITLWTGISTISAEGLRNWLSSFGVRYFKTQEPSDLEYDPQLEVVAEWRDLAALKKDRIDNAVVDAMLENAERGERLEFPWYELPAGRLAKAYSLVLNSFGSTGPIPEGMSAPSALRNKSYTARHQHYARLVEQRADSFVNEFGYHAPYWRLLDMARITVTDDTSD